MIYKIENREVVWDEFLNALNTCAYKCIANEYEHNLVIDKERIIQDLKKQLAGMDYKTSKRTDGEYTEDEWQSIVTERKAIRNKIKQIEQEI